MTGTKTGPKTCHKFKIQHKCCAYHSWIHITLHYKEFITISNTKEKTLCTPGQRMLTKQDTKAALDWKSSIGRNDYYVVNTVVIGFGPITDSGLAYLITFFSNKNVTLLITSLHQFVFLRTIHLLELDIINHLFWFIKTSSNYYFMHVIFKAGDIFSMVKNKM